MNDKLESKHIPMVRDCSLNWNTHEKHENLLSSIRIEYFFLQQVKRL